METFPKQMNPSEALKQIIYLLNVSNVVLGLATVFTPEFQQFLLKLKEAVDEEIKNGGDLNDCN